MVHIESGSIWDLKPPTMKSISFSKKLMYLLLKGPSGQTATRVRRAWMCLKFTDIGWA